jgi:hypothetical protein
MGRLTPSSGSGTDRCFAGFGSPNGSGDPPVGFAPARQVETTVAVEDVCFTGYIPSPLDEATYHTLVNDFFIGVPHLTKCLLRDEVLPAKWCLDYDMRYVYPLPMLEWRMEYGHGWSISPGVNGKGLRRRLPPSIGALQPRPGFCHWDNVGLASLPEAKRGEGGHR